MASHRIDSATARCLKLLPVGAGIVVAGVLGIHSLSAAAPSRPTSAAPGPVTAPVAPELVTTPAAVTAAAVTPPLPATPATAVPGTAKPSRPAASTRAVPARASHPAATATKATHSGAQNSGSPTSFDFFSSDSAGRPARWDPCTPIRWALNPDQAPGGAQQLTEDAVRRLGTATGLTFTFIGNTTFKPLGDHASTYPAGIDAVIAFATASEYPDLAGGTFGLGGFTTTTTASGPRIRHGGVVLNAALVTSVPDGFGPGQRRGGALLHELGHMVGLDHVDDTTQLMNPSITTTSPAGYAAGDSAGLAKVGRSAGCFPAPGA